MVQFMEAAKRAIATVCYDQKLKKKVFAYQSVGFWSQKKNGVTPKW